VVSDLKQEEKMPTLNNYFEKLKPIQQEYLVMCMLRHGNRPDFHQGLIPFLDAQEAAKCLELHLVLMKQQAIGPIKGEKFIRGIMSVFADAVSYKLHKDEESINIMLNDYLLHKYFKRRFSKHFYVIQDPRNNLPRHIGLVSLEWLSKDYWKVTAQRGQLNYATTWLTDMFR
jgi:hypothetical protein